MSWGIVFKSKLKGDIKLTQSTMSLVLYFAVFFGIMYFLMIRPQQKQAKKRQALLSGIKARDQIITAGGLYGKITELSFTFVIFP